MNGENLRAALESAGLNLLSVLDSSLVDDPSIPRGTRSLLLIGNAGDALWQAMPARYLRREHPIDDYSTETVTRALTQYLPEGGGQILFPSAGSETKVPNLQRLGELAGWHRPSPLGSGINEKHGLWFAYRVLVALSRPLAASENEQRHAGSPCLACFDTPCISACPASALALHQAPNLGSCMNYRTAAESLCAENCLARTSCPVAKEWRYSDDQIKYLYRRSLGSLQAWVSANTD